MARFTIALIIAMAAVTFAGCFDRKELAEKSFGKMDDPKSKASPANVISMGRDDDDGKAKKWHIGGRD